MFVAIEIVSIYRVSIYRSRVEEQEVDEDLALLNTSYFLLLVLQFTALFS